MSLRDQNVAIRPPGDAVGAPPSLILSTSHVPLDTGKAQSSEYSSSLSTSENGPPILVIRSAQGGFNVYGRQCPHELRHPVR